MGKFINNYIDYISHAKNRKELIYTLIFGLLGAAASMLFTITTTLNIKLIHPNVHNSLSEQIKEVQSAINNLSSLETYLEKIKNDMTLTQEAKTKIEVEYNQAKELEKLTDKQIEAISLAVNKKTMFQWIMNYFWGFVLGVCSSLLASFVYGYIKQKRNQALSSE
jgi:hypothetical protein